jgi:hypothetical protein
MGLKSTAADHFFSSSNEFISKIVAQRQRNVQVVNSFTDHSILRLRPTIFPFPILTPGSSNVIFSPFRLCIYLDLDLGVSHSFFLPLYSLQTLRTSECAHSIWFFSVCSAMCSLHLQFFSLYILFIYPSIRTLTSTSKTIFEIFYSLLV